MITLIPLQMADEEAPNPETIPALLAEAVSKFREGDCELPDKEFKKKFRTFKLSDFPVVKITMKDGTSRSFDPKLWTYGSVMRHNNLPDIYKKQVTYGLKYICNFVTAPSPQPAEPAAGPSAVSHDAEMPPPNREAPAAENQPPLKKRAGEDDAGPAGMGSAAPAMGSSGAPLNVRSSVSTGSGQITFRKIHRIYTYGYAFSLKEHTIASTTALNVNKQYMLKTPLCCIPWDKPYFYMTPSEYHLLPSTAIVQSCNVKVKFRNCRQSFQTNTSATATATLNQYQDIVTCVNANQELDALSGYYAGSFDHKKMTYADLNVITQDKHKEIAKTMWGVAENDDDFGTTMPRSVVGVPILLNYYLALFTESSNPQRAGWNMLSQHLNVFDGDLAAGNIILDQTYTPSCGFLKTPYAAIFRPYPAYDDSAAVTKLFQIPTASKVLYSSVADFKHTVAQTGGLVTVQSREAETVNGSTVTFGYYDDFDKSQITQIAMHNVYPSVQPSIHIGVLPSKSASGKDLVTETEEYTDMQAYFEVEATCTVSFELPTRFPHATVPNVHPNNQVLLHKNRKVNEGATLICGLKRYVEK